MISNLKKFYVMIYLIIIDIRGKTNFKIQFQLYHISTYSNIYKIYFHTISYHQVHDDNSNKRDSNIFFKNYAVSQTMPHNNTSTNIHYLIKVLFFVNLQMYVKKKIKHYIISEYSIYSKQLDNH